MKKLLLALLMTVFCLSLFTACNGGDSSASDSPNTGSNSGEESTDTGSNGGSYEGWEVIDPIGNGGDYKFND